MSAAWATRRGSRRVWRIATNDWRLAPCDRRPAWCWAAPASRSRRAPRSNRRRLSPTSAPPDCRRTSTGRSISTRAGAPSGSPTPLQQPEGTRFRKTSAISGSRATSSRRCRRRYTLASSSELYGKVSVVGERTYGSVPELYGTDVSSFGPEDAFIGWRSGTVDRIERERVDFTVGRVAVPPRPRLAAVGRRRRGRQPRRLLDQRAQGVRIRRPSAASSRGRTPSKSFYLDKDELDESDSGTRLWGTNYELALGEDTTIGATYLKFFADADVRAGARRLERLQPARVLARRCRPRRICRSSSSMRRSATATRSIRTPGRCRAPTSSARSAGSRSSPIATRSFRATIRRRRRNEAFDPLLLGFYDWGTWWQGEIAGEYFLSNSNLISHQIRAHVTPTDRSAAA